MSWDDRQSRGPRTRTVGRGRMLTGLVVTLALLLALGCAQAQGDADAAPADAAPAGEAEAIRAAKVPKMCWAHYIGWGMHFDTDFNAPERLTQLYDRNLLGGWTGTDTGVSSTTRQQVLQAMQYGIDGFTVDITNPKAYTGLRRLYEAAEGTAFKISLCVDGWHGSTEEVVEGLSAFLDAYGDHPNNAYIDGKPVIFIYKTSVADEKSAAILKALAARGHEAYWLMQPMRETSLWEDAARLDSSLGVFDGLYDFGINGFTPAQIATRLANGKASLERVRPGTGILCAGITQGYMGVSNGFYRPYLNSETMRNNWQAAMDVDADWVCLTTWNDYIESTQFEPSVWNRDALAKLNLDYVREWKGIAPPARKPDVVFAYHSEVLLGNDLTIEAISLSYSTAPARLALRLVDPAGATVRAFAPVALPQTERGVFTFRVEAAGIDGERRLRPQYAILEGAAKAPPTDQDTAWQELYPITVRPGILQDTRTVRMSAADFFARPTLSVSEGAEHLTFRASFTSWSWVGQAELIRNGNTVASQDIAKFGPEMTDVPFTVARRSGQFPQDLYTVRLTRADGRMAWTNPVWIDRSAAPGAAGGAAPADAADAATTVALPVIVRGADFEESWFDRPWLRPWRLAEPELETVQVDAAEVFTVLLPMTAETPPLAVAEGGWSVPVQAGGPLRWYNSTKAELAPTWTRGVGPAGTERALLSFDGADDRLQLPSRRLPFGPLTVEAWIKPAANSEAMTVFSDQNGAFELGMDAGGKPYVKRRSGFAWSPVSVATDAWTHLAGVYDGSDLILYVNFDEVQRERVGPSIVALNSKPGIGMKVREFQDFADFYKGAMAGLALTARPLAPDAFLLRAK